MKAYIKPEIEMNLFVTEEFTSGTGTGTEWIGSGTETDDNPVVP